MPTMHQKGPQRMVIHVKDIQILLGKSRRTASNHLQRIRWELKKSSDQFVTIKEFCEFTGLKEKEVRQHIIA